MLVRVSDPTVVPDLVRTLEREARYVVQRQRREDLLRVGVLGSFADGGAQELTEFLASWQAAYDGIAVDVLDD